MTRSRRYQTLPPRAHCNGCGWQDAGSGVTATAEAEACAYADAEGHATALVISSMVLISPEPAMAGEVPGG